MFCGLDLGTSSVKAFIFDEKGNQLACSRRECELVLPQIGWAELDPESYLQKVYEVLYEVSQQYEKEISVIAISSQAQAILPIDTDGRSLYNIIVTMDNRTVKQYQYWKENYDEWEIYQKTGNAFSAIYAVNKIMWLKENLPEVFRKAWKFCCVQDYIVFMLSGEDPVIDYSMAGRTMMFSQQNLAWQDDILRIGQIGKDRLSRPVASTTIVGKVKTELKDRLHLKGDCKIVMGGHDQACGAIGSGVISPGMLMDACGTVDAMVTVLPGLTLDRNMLKNNLPCYKHADKDNYITMAINTNGGLFFKWYKSTFFHEESRFCCKQNRDIYTHIIEESSDLPSDIYVLPHLEGAGTPISDPQSLGAVIGLRVSHTKKDISRAVLDSLAYEMKSNLLAIEQSTGEPIKEIRIIGGGSKTSKWLQIKADVFNRSIATLDVEEAASLGAAVIGAVGIGYYQTFEQAIRNMVHLKKIYTPNPDMVEDYEIRYSEYKEIYSSLKDLNHKISNRTS